MPTFFNILDLGQLLSALIVPTLLIIAAIYAIRLMAAKSRELSQGKKENPELFREVIQRIGSGAEFREFMNTPGARNLIRLVNPETASQEDPREATLRVMYLGIVITSFGIGIVLATRFGLPEFASIITMIGVGFVTASVISLQFQERWREERRQRDELDRQFDAEWSPTNVLRGKRDREAQAPVTSRHDPRGRTPESGSPRESSDSPHELG